MQLIIAPHSVQIDECDLFRRESSLFQRIFDWDLVSLLNNNWNARRSERSGMKRGKTDNLHLIFICEDKSYVFPMNISIFCRSISPSNLQLSRAVKSRLFSSGDSQLDLTTRQLINPKASKQFAADENLWRKVTIIIYQSRMGFHLKCSNATPKPYKSIWMRVLVGSRLSDHWIVFCARRFR